MLKIVLLVTGVAALLLSFIPSLRTEATPFLQHPDAIYLAILGLINLLFAPVLQSSHPTRPLQAWRSRPAGPGRRPAGTDPAGAAADHRRPAGDRPAPAKPGAGHGPATGGQPETRQTGLAQRQRPGSPRRQPGQRRPGDRYREVVQHLKRFRLHFPRFGRGHLRPLPSDSRRRPPHPHRRPARGVLGGTTGQGLQAEDVIASRR